MNFVPPIVTRAFFASGSETSEVPAARSLTALISGEPGQQTYRAENHCKLFLTENNFLFIVDFFGRFFQYKSGAFYTGNAPLSYFFNFYCTA